MVGAVVCLGLAAPMPSAAQPSDADRAAAKQAFEEGLDLEKKGDYSGAFAKFQKVGAFKMTPHVRFHMALCDEKLGRLVAALRGFELAEAEALKMGKDAQVVADKAPERVEALRKRVASVRIEVKGRVLHSRVLLDGQPVASKDWGTLVPVDPGGHVIAVELDGAITQKKELTLPEKGYETIHLEIEDKEKPPPAATATVTATASASAPPPPPPPPSPVPAIALGGAGLLSLVGAGVFYGLRVGALGDFDQKCPAPAGGGERVCGPDAKGSYDSAQSFTIAAGVLVGVGAAALGGAGAYWFLTQRKAAAPASSPGGGAQVGPAIGVGVTAGGLQVVGRF